MNLDLNAPILVIGGGKMGSALLQGWIEAGLNPKWVTVIEPNAERRNLLAPLGAVTTFENAEALPASFAPSVILIAIKPQNFAAVLPFYEKFAGQKPLIISIAAGRSIAGLGEYFGTEQAIVRAMPNTPAAIGQGISVLCANAHVSDAQRELATNLLAAVGEAVWIESEDLMHPVTALSGGGPAYVFLLVETLARAGANMGLPDDLAMRLARVTVQGAGQLLAASGQPASMLRAEVTSPGGTTQAALKAFMGDHGLQELCDRAIAGGDQRSRELA